MRSRALWLALLLATALSLFGVSAYFSLYRASPPLLAALADTPVTGNIISDTTWTKAGSPYLASGTIRVQAGVTLTIEPGVEVRFANGARLDVVGQVRAIGTPTEPISFTAETQTPGSWQGIQLAGTTVNFVHGSVFKYVLIEYGGLAIANGAGLRLDYASAIIEKSTIRHSAGHGLYGRLRGPTTVSAVSFIGNAKYAALFDDLRFDPFLEFLSADDNGVDGVGIGGAGGELLGVTEWENPGIPYFVRSLISVDQEAILEIKPATEVHFEPTGSLHIAGRLIAIGEATAPITLTATDKTPGSWNGIRVLGAEHRAVATISYATIEYGGEGDDGANIYAQSGYVSIDHSIIRHGGASGVYLWSDTSGSVIEGSQIVDHPNYAIFNLEETAGSTVLAHYNWWGHPNGPTAETNCNPGGSGGLVSQGVAYLPFLTSENAEIPPIAPPDARQITLTPQKWFATANGTNPVYVNITLRDGNGLPLSGRRVRLTTTLGEVVDGGLTDHLGKTLAIVRSFDDGDATLQAVIDLADTCEFARSNSATITFTNEEAADPLFPDSAAPYISEDITLSPMPVTRGAPSTVKAELTNPSPVTVTIDATFGIAQAGIGLAFGPIGEVTNVVIPPNGSVTLSQEWTPAFVGHFCIRLEYTVHPAEGEVIIAQRRGRQLKNFDARPGPMLNHTTKDSAFQKAKRYTDYADDLDFARNSLEKVDHARRFAMIPSALLQDQMVGNILDFQFEAGGASICALQGGKNCGGWRGPRLKIPGKESIGNLMEDPPSPDFQELVVLDDLSQFYDPLTPGTDFPTARVEALNALIAASLDLNNYLFGAALSHDRYGGAVDAGNTEWMALQAGAYLYYLWEAGKAFYDVADKIDALAAELKDEGFVTNAVSAEDYAAYQDRLREEGFTEVEKQAARFVGMDDDAIEAIRQDRLAHDPNAVAGDVFADWAALAQVYREVGRAILAPPAFGGGGSPGILQSLPEHQLVRIFELPFAVPFGNPLATEATIELQARPIDLPADWAVHITPKSAELAPGETMTATVTIIPGAPVAQGVLPRVAIEGYAGDELIGGLVLGIGVPFEREFDGTIRMYLPDLGKQLE